MQDDFRLIQVTTQSQWDQALDLWRTYCQEPTRDLEFGAGTTFMGTALPGSDADEVHLLGLAGQHAAMRVIAYGWLTVSWCHGYASTGGLVARRYRRQGFGRALLQGRMAWAFATLGLGRLQTAVWATNRASLANVAASGMRHEGVARAARRARGEPIDVHEYGMLRAEWVALGRPGLAFLPTRAAR